MDEIHTPDKTQRDAAFVESKENSEQMVHRLRSWESGDILWGWDSVSAEGAATGKTFRRGKDTLDGDGELSGQTAPDAARDAYESIKDSDADLRGATPGTSVFLYAARIESVRTEGGSSHDPEPPLKFASLTDVAVVESAYIPTEDELDFVSHAAAEAARESFISTFGLHDALVERSDEIFAIEDPDDSVADSYVRHRLIAAYDGIDVWMLDEDGPFQAYYYEDSTFGTVGSTSEVANEVVSTLRGAATW